jgi:hypothetical protein
MLCAMDALRHGLLAPTRKGANRKRLSLTILTTADHLMLFGYVSSITNKLTPFSQI